MELVVQSNENILLGHLRVAGSIFRVIAIGKWLVKQFHEKKAEKEKDGSLKFSDKRTSDYFENFLSGGELCDFPELRNSLEKYAHFQLGTKEKSKLKSIYYQHQKKPQELRFDEFSKYDWWLTKGPEMSESDMVLMEKYKQFLARTILESATFSPTTLKNKKVKKEREKNC